MRLIYLNIAGFGVGSLLGGFLYSYLGGCNSFRLMALIALLASFLHALLYKLVAQTETKGKINLKKIVSNH